MDNEKDNALEWRQSIITNENWSSAQSMCTSLCALLHLYSMAAIWHELAIVHCILGRLVPSVCLVADQCQCTDLSNLAPCVKYALILLLPTMQFLL